MATVHLDGPVGLRWNQVNVKNYQEDQTRVIGLLRRIGVADGGKREAWPAPILPGGDGRCAPDLVAAIWDFQKHWQKRGVFKNIDGVVDPGGHTVFRLNLLAGGGDVPPEPNPEDLKPIIRNPRVPGTWQVTNVWGLALGEVGLVGGSKVEITQPDGKKFEITGLGAGFGYSVDPVAIAKIFTKGASALNPLAEIEKATLKQLGESLAKAGAFGFGDFYQLAGGILSSVTNGVLVPNPLNKFFRRPTVVSRYLITEAGNANYAIGSVGGGVGFGGEWGLMGFGGPIVAGNLWLCPVIGYYGSAGATAKVGVGAQIMAYSPTSVKDV